MANKTKDQNELTEEEAAKRRDQIAKRMLNTPPKPRTPKDWPQDDTPGDPNDPRCPSR